MANQTLLAAAGPDLPLIATGIGAGLRLEELFNLEWPEVVFEQNLIRVITKAGTKTEEGFTTKNDEWRIVPLYPNLKEILYAIRKPSGICFRERGWRDRWDALREKTKITYKFHALRHTFGAWCAFNGIPIPVLQQWMGHKHIETTMIYARLRPESCMQYAGRINFGHGFGHGVNIQPNNPINVTPL